MLRFCGVPLTGKGEWEMINAEKEIKKQSGEISGLSEKFVSGNRY